MTGKIAVNLAHTKNDKNGDALGDLLSQAITITCPGIRKESELAQKREAIWITRWAVRAVCELVIREGKIKLPLQVHYAGDLWPIPWRNDRGEYGLN